MKHIKITQGAYLDGYDGAFTDLTMRKATSFQQGFGIIGTKPAPKMRTAKNIRSSGKSQTKKPLKMVRKYTPANGATLPTLRTIMASA